MSMYVWEKYRNVCFGHYCEVPLSSVLSSFAEKARYKIFVSHCRGVEMCEPYDEPEYDLCIFFGAMSVPCEESRMMLAYGYPLQEEQSLCCLASGDNIPQGKYIYDPDGYPVAIIDGRSLYILFCLSLGNNEETDNSKKILELILEDYYLYLTHKNLFAREMRKRLEGKDTKQFSRLFEMANIVTAENRLGRSRYVIADLSDRLTSDVRELMILSGVRKSSFNKAKITKIYDGLCRLSSTGEISISSLLHKITIPVGQIDIQFEGVTYSIGNFEICLRTASCSFSCHNHTLSHRLFYHPHIFDDGRCDLGVATYGVSVLMGKMEFVTVAEMLIRFLRSYDPNTCLKEITYWPVKEEIDE